MTRRTPFDIRKLSLAAAAVAIGLASAAQAGAATTYTHPSEHFSLTVPTGLMPLTAAELARGNAAVAAEGGAPRLFEVGFAPPAPAGGGGQTPRYPVLLVRFVPGRTTVQSFADSYRADLARSAAAATAPSGDRPAGQPVSAAPTVTVDDAAHTVSVEQRGTAADGRPLVKRRTLFVGHDGVAEVDWKATAADTDRDLPGLLASFHFDAGHQYGAGGAAVARTSASGGRRTVATVIWVGGSLLFLAVAIGFFVRARSRKA